MYEQQGDVLLKKIDALPKGNYKKTSVRKAILAEGEQTGHNHTLISALMPFTIFENENTGDVFVELTQPANVKHQEHLPFEDEVFPGIYKIEIINEYDHFLEETRKVLD